MSFLFVRAYAYIYIFICVKHVNKDHIDSPGDGLMMFPRASLTSLRTFTDSGVKRVASPIKLLILGFAEMVAVVHVKRWV